jgi:DNA-binding NtrC family response regulator
VVDIARLVRDSTPLAEIVGQVEKQALSEAMEASKGDRSEAARLLGLDRPVLYEKLKEYGLSS